jgi:hypothetical protein
MRCIEAAVHSPFSNAEQTLEAAQEWFDWILLPPAPPRGRTSAARSKMEAQKKK